MCNFVCVGIGQFLAPIILAAVAFAILAAIGEAIGRNIAQGARERQRVRAYEEAQRARLGKDWRKALKKEELARLMGEISLARCQLDFDLQHFRGELARANSQCNWGWPIEEIDARVAQAARGKREAAPYLKKRLESLERQAAAIKV